MFRTIYGCVLSPTDARGVYEAVVPVGANALSVRTDDCGVMTIDCLADVTGPDTVYAHRLFRVVAHGERIEAFVGGKSFVGSVPCLGVVHFVFEME